jgi:phosphoglycolate phosphatase
LYSYLQPDPMKSSISQLVNDVKLDADVGAVVVGFDEHFSLPKMMKAATYLEREGSLFIATNTDERFPTDTHIMPGKMFLVFSMFGIKYLCVF